MTRRSTKELRQEVERLNKLIARIETKPQREWTVWANTLRDLVEERELIGLLILNRNIEASKPVVNLRRWVEGPWAA